MNHPSENPTPETSQASASAARRRWLLLGVGAVAGLGGAGLAAWRLRPGAVKEGAHETLWDASFEDLGGQPLRMASMRGRPLLLNFWATWCPPCIAELPLLNTFYRENTGKNWQVLGIAVDQLASVKTFLERTPLDFPVAMAGQGGIELVRSLGNLQGGLPFTVVFAADGRILQRKMGQATAEDLRTWAAMV